VKAPERVSEPGDTWRFFLTFKDGSTYLDTMSIDTNSAQRNDVHATSDPQDFANMLNPESSSNQEMIVAWVQPVTKIQRVRERDGYTYPVWSASRTASDWNHNKTPGTYNVNDRDRRR
jgi:hypothetical protein